jgi:curved DNA-binding protein CbpA
MPEQQFVDYYELMQISPGADRDTIQRVYRILAARYHPDNPETGDVEKFLLLKRAHDILLQSGARAAYNVAREQHNQKPISVFSMKDFAVGIDGEANRRLGVLCLLYSQRRTAPDAPGYSVLDLESAMSFAREHLMFTLWYLIEKDHVRRDEQSNYVITAEGVDYVESNLSSNQVLYRLLKAAENGHSMREDTAVWMMDGESVPESSITAHRRNGWG